MSLPPEIQTFLRMAAIDMREAADTKELQQIRPALIGRLKSHAVAFERLAMELGRSGAAASAKAPKGPPGDIH